MKHLKFRVTVLVCFLIFSSFSFAKDKADKQSKLNSHIIIKVGSTQLAETDQTPSTLSLNFDNNSITFAIEVEISNKNNIAYGIEYVGFTHSYTAFNGQGKYRTRLLLFNAKKYFDYSKTIKPFVSTGVGLSTGKALGQFFGSGDGFAFQLTGGFIYRSKNYDIQTELRWTQATIDDSNSVEVNSSGLSLMVGVRFPFIF